MTNAFGSVLKKVRMNKNMSQTEVCEGIMTRSYYSKIESNSSIPSLDKMMQLLNRLNMTFDEYFYILNEYKTNQKERLYHLILKGFLSSDEDDLWGKAQKEAAMLYTETGDNYYDYMAITAKYLSHRYGIEEKPSEASMNKIKDYLYSTDYYYQVDLFLFNIFIHEYPIEAVDLLSDRILKSIYDYDGLLAQGEESLFILINLVFYYYSHNKVDKGDFYYLLLAKRQQKAIHIYEKVNFRFLAGVRCVLLGETEKGIKLCEKEIKLLQEFRLDRAASRLQSRLARMVELVQ